MFSHIKTSKENKDVVTQLTNKLHLGAENVIARIALTYSLGQEEKLDLKNIKDYGGKEYSKSVLFGENYEIYIGLILMKYNIHFSNKDLSKYIKLHLDEGLESINDQVKNQLNLDSFSFINNLVTN